MGVVGRSPYSDTTSEISVENFRVWPPDLDVRKAYFVLELLKPRGTNTTLRATRSIL